MESRSHLWVELKNHSLLPSGLCRDLSRHSKGETTVTARDSAVAVLQRTSVLPISSALPNLTA
jgi:hypothetical protein